MQELAENYSKHSKQQYTGGINFLSQLNIQAGQSVLDVGCGTGELAAFLADKVGQRGRVLGIDPAGDRITLALEKFKNVPNLSFAQAGISEIPRGELYDVVFSNRVFHWIPNDQLVKDLAFIREHCMKPGAILACEMCSSIPDLEKARLLLPEDNPLKLFFRNEVEYRSLFSRAGFEDMTFENVEEIVVFDDMQPLRDMIYYGTGCTFDIFDERLSSFKWTTNSSGKVVYYAIMIRVQAKKHV